MSLQPSVRQGATSEEFRHDAAVDVCAQSLPLANHQVKNCTRSEAEQASEGSKWALLLRRLARRIVTGRIIPSHDDGGFPHAFRRHEIVERGGVRQREADAAVRDGRAEARMVEPWMLWPRVVKKIACGMPALSHSWE